MSWNWQQKDWPFFTYYSTDLESFEREFAHRSGVALGSFQHLQKTDKDQFKVEIVSDEALKTSAIEGEYLNRDSVQSSILRQFGLESNARKVSPAEHGIAEMMVDLYRSYQQPLTHHTLCSWQQMLTSGRRDLKDIGRYRTHEEAMQIISGAVDSPKLHFEAPPSSAVYDEMEQFVEWFNDSSPMGKKPLPALTRAGITHLYFVCIHPFEDGNGRIGRALAEKALAQCLNRPTLIALAFCIHKHKKAYYQALAQANRSNQISEWLIYFAKTVLLAQSYTQARIHFLIEKSKLYDRVRGLLNERQEKVLARMFRAGPEGFKGGLSADKYIRITKTSRATATRDLQDLVYKDVLEKVGELKYTRYHLNINPINF